ncbi:MAG: TlyA family RNA methyltransferase [Clostridiales bacterium]|nr:TlyA family RNA methyltransferase [Clostridiales bacterium]
MKKRLDVVLVEQGHAQSRERAKAMIMAGIVYVNDQKADKAGTTVKEDDMVEVRGNTLRYVSRGGLKLEKAMASFDISLEGSVCCDFGASTGGFTDCMLQNGAVWVYAVDVGYGELAWSLRGDPRVINMERTNIRYLTDEQIPEPIDFISVDVSFISLTLILPVVYRFLRQGGSCACLVKPQFEAGREKVGKNGIIRDPAVHLEVVQKIYRFALEQGFAVDGLDFSPIKGAKGNIEYLMYLKKDGGESSVTEGDLVLTVGSSHEDLDD